MRSAVVIVALLLAGVAEAQSPLPPRDKHALLEWLRTGVYRETYVPEPAVHPSAGPHGGNVRVWLHPTLVEDLRTGHVPFRKGAAMVKELYFDGEETVVGYSVMRKVRRRSGARGGGWLFLESFDGVGAPYFGRGTVPGARLCAGCHAAGVDFLLSPFRP